jgi:hypothetical protein
MSHLNLSERHGLPLSTRQVYLLNNFDCSSIAASALVVVVAAPFALDVAIVVYYMDIVGNMDCYLDTFFFSLLSLA